MTLLYANEKYDPECKNNTSNGAIDFSYKYSADFGTEEDEVRFMLVLLNFIDHSHRFSYAGKIGPKYDYKGNNGHTLLSYFQYLSEQGKLVETFKDHIRLELVQTKDYQKRFSTIHRANMRPIMDAATASGFNSTLPGYLSGIEYGNQAIVTKQMSYYPLLRKDCIYTLSYSSWNGADYLTLHKDQVIPIAYDSLNKLDLSSFELPLYGHATYRDVAMKKVDIHPLFALAYMSNYKKRSRLRRYSHKRFHLDLLDDAHNELIKSFLRRCADKFITTSG